MVAAHPHIDPAAGLTLKYDAWNRLVEVTDGTTVVGKYEYDGLNRRILNYRDFVDYEVYEHYYYNASWQVLETRFDFSGNPPEGLQPWLQYVWSARYIDALVLRDQNTDSDGLCDDERLYYLTDANFNVTALVDTGGTVLERYVYDPYGKVTIYWPDWSSTLSASNYYNRILYTGREYDPETGLYNYRSRPYHAELGRFPGRDPIGARNLYLYVAANPVADLDPYGLLSRKACEKKLDGLKKHIQQLEDHDSEGHCNSLRSVLDMFVSGGCRKWAKSFKERLDKFEDFYRKKCEDPDDDSDDKCPDPTPEYYYGTPFSGLQNLLESLGELIGLDLSGIPVIAGPMPLPAGPIRPVPTIPPGVRVPAGAAPLPSIRRPAWSVLENPERDFQNKLPFGPLPDEAGPGSEVPGWYSEAMDKWGTTGEKPPAEFFQRLDKWQAKHP